MDDPSKDDPPKFRILVIDDNRDLADSTAILLQLSGFDVCTIYDPREAVQAAKEFCPDCILSDITMPGIDGYKLASLFREEESFKDTPLVAMTAYIQEDRAKAVGFGYHLLKPADPLTLVNLLRRILRMESRRLEGFEKTVQQHTEVVSEVKELMKEVKEDVKEIKEGLTGEVKELKQKLDEVKEDVKEIKKGLKEDKSQDDEPEKDSTST